MSSSTVKINSKGSVQISLSRNQAELIKPIITRLVERISGELLHRGGQKPLTLSNSNLMQKVYLLREVYTKYYTDLDMIKDIYKMTWTPAQAICFWECSQLFSEVVYCHPVINKFMYELHQKLS
ncbi:hypothetical protein JMN32_19730 [Fulvivirga sp. 29W222]|uniref:Uncharacterized protein n=1 Tax=Fulvivirga marina TaxID=2494733 RepID=A0A937G1N6_9BACT|nr:hypothetical protein [Fulvivirga marina]MBL6448551.1 hypothetical protein [Fulvivirga marina]